LTLVRVAVDAMGGDHAPGEIVRGAAAALCARDDLQLTLVGRQNQVHEALQGLSYPDSRLKTVHAEEVIQPDDEPGLAIRSKKNASMVAALQMVREGRADAVLSTGNTGALMAGGLLLMGRLSGISRPALLTVLPSFSGEPVVILDVGANMDSRPEQLVQYALWGESTPSKSSAGRIQG
jgi:phosphate acyltransferase